MPPCGLIGGLFNGHWFKLLMIIAMVVFIVVCHQVVVDSVQDSVSKTDFQVAMDDMLTTDVYRELDAALDAANTAYDTAQDTLGFDIVDGQLQYPQARFDTLEMDKEEADNAVRAFLRFYRQCEIDYLERNVQGFQDLNDGFVQGFYGVEVRGDGIIPEHVADVLENGPEEEGIHCRWWTGLQNAKQALEEFNQTYMDPMMDEEQALELFHEDYSDELNERPDRMRYFKDENYVHRYRFTSYGEVMDTLNAAQSAIDGLDLEYQNAEIEYAQMKENVQNAADDLKTYQRDYETEYAKAFNIIGSNYADILNGCNGEEITGEAANTIFMVTTAGTAAIGMGQAFYHKSKYMALFFVVIAILALGFGVDGCGVENKNMYFLNVTQYFLYAFAGSIILMEGIMYLKSEVYDKKKSEGQPTNGITSVVGPFVQNPSATPACDVPPQHDIVIEAETEDEKHMEVPPSAPPLEPSVSPAPASEEPVSPTPVRENVRAREQTRVPPRTTRTTSSNEPASESDARLIPGPVPQRLPQCAERGAPVTLPVPLASRLQRKIRESGN